MNQPNPQTPVVSPVKQGDQTQPNKDSPPFTALTPIPARNEVKPPLQAAKGNDEVMSQPPAKQS